MIKMVRVESEVFVGVGRFIVNIPTPMDSLLSCELSYKLNDHLSLFKASKRRNLLFQGIFFQTTRSLRLTSCQYPMNNYFELEPKAAVFIFAH